DRNRSHWSTSKTPSYTKSVSWQHHPNGNVTLNFFANYRALASGVRPGVAKADAIFMINYN
ncbi:hypothetical protein P2P22_22970, partial [Escherichia coli]